MAATNAQTKEQLDAVLTDLLSIDGLLKAHRMIRCDYDVWASKPTDPDVRLALDAIAEAIYVLNSNAINRCDP